MSQEIHELIYKTNAADIKKAEEEYKRLTDAEKSQNKIAVNDKQTSNKIKLEEEKRLTKNINAEIDIRKKKEIDALNQIKSERTKANATQTKADMFSQQTSLAKTSLGGFTASSIGGVQSQITALKTYQKTLAPLSTEAALVTSRIGELNSMIGKNAGQFSSALSSVQPYLVGMLSMGTALETVHFAFESFMEAGRLEQLKGIVSVTTEDLEKFKVAAGSTVDDTTLLKMVQYANSLDKTSEETTLAIQQARMLSRVTGEDVYTSFNAIVKSTDGYMKAISGLKLSKTKYNEILKEEVTNLKGQYDIQEGVNGQQEINIKNLTAEQQVKVRSTAFNRLFAESYGDVSNAQLDAIEKTKGLKVAWDEFKEGFGSSFVEISNMKGALGEDAKSMAEFQESVKSAGSTISKVLTGGVLTDFVNKINETTYSWMGMKNEVEKPVHINIEIPNLGSVQNAVDRILYAKQLLMQTEGVPLKDLPLELQKGFAKKITPTSKSSGPSGKSPSVQEKTEELNLIKLQTQELVKLQTQLTANLGDYGAELEIRQKILEVTERIAFLQKGLGDIGSINGLTRPSLNFDITGKEEDIIRINGDRMRKELADRIALEEEEKNKHTLETAGLIKDDFINMLQNTGLMKGDFAKIISMIESIISGGSSIFKLVGTIGGFLLGGPAGAIAGGAIGGGISGGGMPAGMPGHIGNIPGAGGGGNPFAGMTLHIQPFSEPGLYNMMKQGNDIIAVRK